MSESPEGQERPAEKDKKPGRQISVTLRGSPTGRRCRRKGCAGSQAPQRPEPEIIWEKAGWGSRKREPAPRWTDGWRGSNEEGETVGVPLTEFPLRRMASCAHEECPRTRSLGLGAGESKEGWQEPERLVHARGSDHPAKRKPRCKPNPSCKKRRGATVFLCISAASCFRKRERTFSGAC